MTRTLSFLEELGEVWQLTDYVVACCIDASGNVAFALGDGTLFIAPANGQSPLTIRLTSVPA